ncbi:hypothetical protein KI387_000230, partial [Taxus chinensis]
ASSTLNVSTLNVGFNYGSRTTSLSIRVHDSTTIRAHGSTSTGPIPTIGGGSE